MSPSEQALVSSFISDRGYEITENPSFFILRIPNSDITEKFNGLHDFWDAYSSLKSKENMLLSEHYYKQLILNDEFTRS